MSSVFIWVWARNWLGLKISAAENFPSASFWRKQSKTQIFLRGKCYFVTVFRTTIQVMASHWSLGDGRWSVKCIYVLDESFLIFPQDFLHKFSEKKRVLKKNLCFIWNLTCSGCLKVMRIIRIEKDIKQCV